MTRLPCLGDILKQAGYRQVYLGGAPMEFAGKGKFLVDHGFDEVRGWEYWEDHGFKQRPDTWGLTDVELFDQAIQTIRDLRKTPPYNLTMLTIGTHLPGSLYQECSPYQGKKDTEPFIQAVHCTDALLGRFVGRLQSEGYLDKNTVLVITADHGVFRTRKMKELFGEMMYDKRLVTIIVGADFPWKTPMAAYDLAPSILSLLSIDHNADFILGTSVFKPNHRTDFFTSRYGDFVNGRYYDNNPARCSGLPNHGNLSLPFDSCGKKNCLFHQLICITVNFPTRK